MSTNVNNNLSYDVQKLENEKNSKLSQLEKLNQKIAQLEAQKQALIAKEKERERKARTKRLIEIGAIIESRLQLNLKQTQNFCDYIYTHPEFLEVIKNIKKDITD